MKNQTCLLFLTFLPLLLSAQINLQGNVVDENNKPIPFASVALIAAKDSLLQKGALTDDGGHYNITEVAAGNYRIFVSFLGYERTYSDAFEIKPESKTATIDFNLQPSATLLNEAVVVAQRPLFEQRADRLIVNVANSPIAAGGTAMEILKKVPGVIMVQDRVTLAGSQNLQIWIDGKPSPYTDMNAALRDMPGDQIDRIELITQPGAKFDAAGGPVLNIVLKRNAELGFNGSAGLNLGGFRVDQSDVGAGKRNYHRVNPNLSVNYRSGKWNLFGNTAYNTGDYFSVIRVKRFIGSEVFRSSNFEETDYTFRNLRMGADYYATSKTTVGLVVRGWARTGQGDAVSETNVFNQDETTRYGSFITENKTDSRRGGYSSNFNIKHDLNAQTGRSLNFDLDYNRFDTDNTNNLTIYENQPNSQRSNSTQDVTQPVNIWVSKADYVHPIDSTFKVETGWKSSFANIDNVLDFYRSGVLAPDASNAFLYQENINAGYLNMSKTVSKFDLNAGIRAEQTRVSGTILDEKVLDRNYLQWFPSASALYRFNKHMGLQASYSRRVNRPGFQQQNPFTTFIDSLTYTRGNPNLLPEINQTGQLAFVYDGQPVASISHSITDDVIIENAPQLEGTKTFTTAANLAQYSEWNFTLNFPIQLGKIIDGYGGNQAIHKSYNATYLNTNYKAERWHWLAYIGVNATLPKDIKIEIEGFYLTKFLEEFLVIGNMGGIDVGVSKTFWDKRGRLSLNFNDILYSQKTNAVIDFNDVRVDFFQREYSRNLRLSFSYKFGNTQVKAARSRSSASSSETSRVKVE